MRPSRYFLMLVLVATTSSCASIVTRSAYPVDFNSEPQGAHLTVENRDGEVVFVGHTPTTTWLEAAAGYMRPERYKVTYSRNDGQHVTTFIHATIDGWYFGNLLFGGLIGMLLIDPLTGAMFKLPPGTGETIIESDLPAPAVPAQAAPAPVPATSAPPATGEWSPLGQ